MNKHGIVFYKQENGKLAKFVPASIQNDTIQAANNSLLGGRMGLSKMKKEF